VQYDYRVAVGGTAVGAGAEQIVESGVLASGLTASGGGEEYVVAGGTASAAIIGSGGLEAVFGIDRGGTISHGTQYDYVTVSGGTIISGGEQIVEAGAVASGMIVDSGGTLEVTSGASGGNVTFASGGILELDSLVAFGGTISGFHLGDEIDLRSLGFTSGTTNLSWTQLTSGANASGTLTVSSGAAVETLTLLGQYTAANFSATSDGAGGTLVTGSADAGDVEAQSTTSGISRAIGARRDSPPRSSSLRAAAVRSFRGLVMRPLLQCHRARSSPSASVPQSAP
jgi:trimeric autotransporter adhesin